MDFDNNNFETPPSSPRDQDEDIPTVTKDTTAEELADITRRNYAVWERMKYKAVPIRGVIILDGNGKKIDNPQGIEHFTQEDEELLRNKNWHKPIYNMHGEDVTGKYLSLFDRVRPLPGYEREDEIVDRVKPHYTDSILHTPIGPTQHRNAVPKAPSKKGTKRQKGDHNGGKRKRRTRNKKNNKKRSNK